MRLTIIGSSGSFPGPASPASCYLVEADGFRLLLDLGNGALGILQRHVDIYGIDAVYLSHLHPDHCSDLCSYWVARTYSEGGPKPRIPVYGPPGVAQRMADAYGLDPDPGMTETFDFHELAPGSLAIGPFTAHLNRVNHPVDAFGIRLEHQGTSLTYSGDTGACDELVGLAAGTDLFLCEASFHDNRDNPKDMHLTGSEAGDHARRAAARRLVLTHLVPWNDVETTLAEARSTFHGPIDIARSGAVFEVGGAALETV
ncbi:MBL fold metallo-hydrolase [Streptomonospora nanhaiensis]|uniref:Ribonuclease BN (tRNA processing enzyme) n=1 Tax=Streptomonospora nanhaiensis TaxID=1323731 RepID=A0A853BMB8_9ACTN|nr:MBL fold metallo-hydrolase [Streptomonospora nanhaiensis]MBV2367143.1 MBL fold metallo-hydrolase [Streptomonospora nanhaiensis]MBX9390469.1 MBL fold metallo-hydrolase [Streptomonospora nanhaiensis]NYI95817.1 ribonuclease BN (tRNA processing enzyme) [Streptomonospora nanhaiensis]